MTDQPVVTVGIADLHVRQSAGIMRICGLGSCVGLTLYDSLAVVAGMAHIMLPSSDGMARNKQHSESKLAKYADIAIAELIRRMKDFGATPSRMEAKLAGGAQMFPFKGYDDTMRIGARNIESCRTVLHVNRIPIAAEDVGGNYGRTIELYCDSGKLIVRSVNHKIKEL